MDSNGRDLLNKPATCVTIMRRPECVESAHCSVQINDFMTLIIVGSHFEASYAMQAEEIKRSVPLQLCRLAFVTIQTVKSLC